MTNVGLCRTPKKPKGVKIDRISGLPDDLISLILSFLPTKEAVATSVLSNRWRSLWSLVPVLKFAGRSSKETRSFLRFFSGRVETLDRSLDVVRLKGKFGSWLGDWVSKLIDCGVRELNLCTTGGKPMRISRHGNLTSKTLVFLRLKRVSFNIPLSVDLPSLKILHLQEVRNPSKKSVGQFISGCPAVEDVIVSHDVLATLSPQRIKLPQSLFTSQALLSLNLDLGISFDFPSIVHLPRLKILHLNISSNVGNNDFVSRLLLECILLEDLDLSTGDGEDPIKVPDHLFISKSLVSLKLEGRISLHFPPSIHLPKLRILYLAGSISGLDKCISGFLSGCPVLEEIDLRDVHTTNKKSSIVCVPTLERLVISLHCRDHLLAYKLKIKAPALKHFEIGCYHSDGEIAWHLPNLQQASILFKHNIPRKLLSTIRNTKVLKFDHHNFEATSPPPNIDVIPKFRHLKCLAIYNPIGLAYLLPEILESSTRLHELRIFGKVKSDSPYSDVAWSIPPYVPHCLLHSLKVFTMYFFRGLDKETQMVNYILRNGRVLRRITVSIHPSHVKQGRRAREKLSAIPWCSRTSQLVFT